MKETDENSSYDSSPDASISWPSGRLSSQQPFTPSLDASFRAATTVPVPPSASTVRPPSPQPPPRDFLPRGERSLSSISLHAFCLGLALSGSAVLAALLAHAGSPFWRPASFVAALSAFHFLEFWTTATYNPPLATVGAFLLSNGPRYTQAHSAALAECLLTTALLPGWQARVAAGGWTVGVGAVLVVVGQAVRSAAMVQAGTNFNHRVQTQRARGHILVTRGVYAWLRHPAYFGFFWWGLGTQLVLGNVLCFGVYAAVLWRFFASRIWAEEKFLVSFFGDDYVKYRALTPVGIPFIS